MKITETITTTITTTIDLETFTPEHRVHVDAEDSALPLEAIYAAVEGGLKATLAEVADRSENR